MVLQTATDGNAWDAFVLEHGGGFLQSWGWGEFQRALGRTVYRYVVVGSSDATAPDSVSVSGGPDVRIDAQFSLITIPLRFGFRYTYVPWGPVLRRGGDPHKQMEMVTVALREASRRERATFARADFPCPISDTVCREDLLSLGYIPTQHMQPADSIIVDLQQGEDALLSAMHPKTRYNIRVAERHGVTVRASDASDPAALRRDAGLFWDMLAETAERDRFHTHPEQYYRVMVDTLGAAAAADPAHCSVRLLFAEYEGRPVAAGLFVRFGSRVTYLHGASRAEDRRLMAPYALHWNAICEAKAAGADSYDFWGVAPNDAPEHPWAGITRFKRGFGGNHVSYLGTWELPESAFWYMLYRRLRSLRD